MLEKKILAQLNSPSPNKNKKGHQLRDLMMETLELQRGLTKINQHTKLPRKTFDNKPFKPPQVVTCHDILMNNIEENLMDMQDLVLLKTIQRYPVRKDMKRAKPGGKSLIDGFADTRKDPIKRKKIYRVLDFVETNK